MDTLGEGRMPYGALLARVQRMAFREFSRDPDLDFAEFERRLGKQIFGDENKSAGVKDLLELQRIFTFESDWYWSSPLTDPDFFAIRANRLKWPEQKLTDYRNSLERLKEIASRYEKSGNSGEREMARVAGHVVTRWGDRTP